MIDIAVTSALLREKATTLILHAEEMDGANSGKRHGARLRESVLAHARYGNHPIIRVIADHFKFSTFAFFRHNRSAEIVMPRHILCYVLYLDVQNWSEVGRMLDRKHSSIMHSYKVVAKRAQQPAFAAMLAALQAKCRDAVADDLKENTLGIKKEEG